MKPLELPAVTRVHTGQGSHIEPPLDQDWDEATKLAWQAAVVAHDTGLRIRVHDEAFVTSNGDAVPGTYSINVGLSSCSALPYRKAWTYLNGVSTGAQQAKLREDE